MSAHAYTEDQLVEQPATIGKAEGSMLKAEALPPEPITAAVPGILCERLAALHRKSFMFSRFLFE